MRDKSAKLRIGIVQSRVVLQNKSANCFVIAFLRIVANIDILRDFFDLISFISEDNWLEMWVTNHMLPAASESFGSKIPGTSSGGGATALSVRRPARKPGALTVTTIGPGCSADRITFPTGV